MTAEELDEEDPAVTPERWSWWWAAGCAVNAVGNVGRLVTSLADEVSCRIARHDLWRAERLEFADSVRRDLEAMPALDRE